MDSIFVNSANTKISRECNESAGLPCWPFLINIHLYLYGLHNLPHILLRKNAGALKEP